MLATTIASSAVSSRAGCPGAPGWIIGETPCTTDGHVNGKRKDRIPKYAWKSSLVRYCLGEVMDWFLWPLSTPRQSEAASEAQDWHRRKLGGTVEGIPQTTSCQRFMIGPSRRIRGGCCVGERMEFPFTTQFRADSSGAFRFRSGQLVRLLPPRRRQRLRTTRLTRRIQRLDSRTVTLLVSVVVTLGHRHRFMAGEVVDLLDGDAEVQHSCDDAMAEIGGADVAKPSSVAPAARSGLPVDGGRHRRPIRVCSGRRGCRQWRRRGAGREWSARSRVGRGLRSIPTPISSGLHQANHGVWLIVTVQRVSDDIRTPCRHATLRHPLLCKADH